MKRNETRHIIDMMKATGNQPGIIARWKMLVAEWAGKTQGNPDAEAVKAWLPQWQTRPFYTAQELAPLWPALAIATGHTNEWRRVPKSARRLEFELDRYGLPRLQNNSEYFIVERIHYWRNAKPEDIEREFDAHR